MCEAVSCDLGNDDILLLLLLSFYSTHFLKMLEQRKYHLNHSLIKSTAPSRVYRYAKKSSFLEKIVPSSYISYPRNIYLLCMKINCFSLVFLLDFSDGICKLSLVYCDCDISS